MARHTVALVLIPLAAASCRCKDEPHAGGRVAAPAVEPASGPSLINRLGVSVDATRMGAHGGSGPAPGTSFGRTTGSDLYRLNCRSCHGPDGSGTPPEINSLLGPVGAMSPGLLVRRAEEAGHPITVQMAKQLAADAERAVQQRIREGGKRMPPALYLRDAEVDALIPYLKELAGAPAAETSAPEIDEPRLRVGELLVRGTCQVCHDATGPGDPHAVMMSRQIPSLESLPRRWSRDTVVGKVLEGRGGMGMMRMRGRTQMPVFSYLTAEEVAAGYDYIAAVPPRP